MTRLPGAAAVEPTDAELVAAVAAGNEGAFRTLYRRHTPRLRGLLLRMVAGNAADADDAVQETWLRAVRGLGTFRGASAFGSWISGIGVRVTWENLRRTHGDVELADHDLGVEPPLTAERLDLEQALARLPARYRIVVVLHDVEGIGHDDIAALLGVAVTTSRSHLFRARRALRAMLSSYERILK
ncbi:MAG TPA: sigma-70 family RNA polymerase sigma factor [Gemmatimonadales bacterium]|jgi:RNA polymerase sigma-70 factor (ECF subfamily)|nr:sigma-70 family RNA polymerase sigma factor [Gemmatimonadales bacterium]